MNQLCMRTLWVVPIALAAVVSLAAADPPELYSWRFNLDGRTGYGGSPADVQAVYYSSDYAYVECTGIPTYTIGPWPDNPNTASNQGWRFKIARHPAADPTPTATGLGHIGVWVNGVVIFNALDAMSYQGRNFWHQNAVVVEGPSFDSCLGHPQMSGVYHHHQNPRCLYSTADTTVHSPIVGFSFDGYPIYGPYGFAATDGSGRIRRIRSSYRLRNITLRTTLPDGTALTPINYGPAVSPTFPLGYYVEDFEYVAGLGDLDAHNGRLAVTPEYPDTTYAYYVTINADGSSAYPYVIGPTYYGELVAGNTGMGSGHVSISESVTRYVPASVGVDPTERPASPFRLVASPNPAASQTMLQLALPEGGQVKVNLYDVRGRLVRAVDAGILPAGTHQVPLSLGNIAPGIYLLDAQAGGAEARSRLVVLR